MTIADTTPIIRHDGNGVNEDFSFTFIFYDDDDLEVIHTDINGANTTLAKTTDYVVTGVGTTSGSVHFPEVGSAFGILATGEQLTIRRVSTKERTPDIEGTFKFATVNLEGDKQTTMIQENTEELTRCLKYTPDNSDTPPDLETIITAINDSVGGVLVAALPIFDSDVPVTVGDGKVGIPITPEISGRNLTNVHVFVDDPGTTGTTDIQIRRRRGGVEVDMLSTKVQLPDGSYYAANGVVNTSNDDLLTGDLLYVDRDAIHSGTAPNGLVVALSAAI